jgi:hypothetical protein
MSARLPERSPQGCKRSGADYTAPDLLLHGSPGLPTYAQHGSTCIPARTAFQGPALRRQPCRSGCGSKRPTPYHRLRRLIQQNRANPLALQSTCTWQPSSHYCLQNFLRQFLTQAFLAASVGFPEHWLTQDRWTCHPQYTVSAASKVPVWRNTANIEAAKAYRCRVLISHSSLSAIRQC